jgi:hypothetical protein
MAHIWSPKFGPYPTYKHGIEDRWCILQVTEVNAQSQSLSTSLEPLKKGTRRNPHIFKLFGKWLELGWGLREPPILPNTCDPGWAQATITDWQEEVVGGWWWGFWCGGSLGIYLPCSYCAFKGRNQQITHPSMLLMHHLDFILFIKSCKLCG